VVEHVSAYITGASGQTYQTFLSLDASEFLVMNKQIPAPGIGTLTASQPTRVCECKPRSCSVRCCYQQRCRELLGARNPLRLSSTHDKSSH
jgi:hypothetical protein